MVGARAMLLDRNVLAQDLYSMHGICVILPDANRKHELRGYFTFPIVCAPSRTLATCLTISMGISLGKRFGLVSLFFRVYLTFEHYTAVRDAFIYRDLPYHNRKLLARE